MTPQTRSSLIAALAWQLEFGADEAIAESPIDRFAEPQARGQIPAAGRGAVPAASRVPAEATDATADAQPDGAGELARRARTLDELAEMMREWPGSPLREGARNFVFADGNPKARVMIVGEAPGAEEDRQGKPFVGRAGQLLDRMIAAIGLDRAAPDAARAVYITNMLPWRPPGNRTPSDQEALAFLPFVLRHIELADPDIVVTMGNAATKPLLSTQTGIRRMRGRWGRLEAQAKPVLPTFHPAYLLRTPAEKKLAWFDMIALARALEKEPQT